MIAGGVGADHSAFITAYNTARGDGTRTPAAIATKNAAKASMIASARALAKIIQGYPSLTNAQRLELGLKAQPLVLMLERRTASGS